MRSAMARILSAPWGGAMALRRALYRGGTLASRAAGLPVVSIGNISLGGTGKSPLVRLLAQAALDGIPQSLSPLLPPLTPPVAILSRGYGRATHGWILVSQGEGPAAGLTARDTGDEPLMLAQQVPDAWVAVCEDRREGARRLRDLGAGCILLDDGYQHMALRRDVNILLWDCAVDPRTEAVLPFGRLRESPAAALDASIIVLGRPTPDDVRQCTDWFSRLFRQAGRDLPPVFVAHSGIGPLLQPGTWKPVTHGLGGRHGVVCGIASPERFLQATVRRLGTPAWTRCHGDHHAWTEADMDELRGAVSLHGLRHLVTTWKDAVRLPADHGLPMLVADQELRIQPARDYLQA